ncbi:MAG: hypothetical protein ACREGG_01940 [Candidatus Saccharimonadales bacterium]
MAVWNWLFVNQPTWVSNVSNLTSITVLGVVVGLYKRFNCNQPRCWRIGHHKVDGTTYRTCSKHTTLEYHTALQKQHAVKHPKQHEFLAHKHKVSD